MGHRRRRRSKSLDLMNNSHQSTDSTLSSQSSSGGTISHPPQHRRKTPLRTASGFGHACFRSMLSSSRYHHHHHHHQEEKKKETELNIFCSDVLVSTEFCLSRMEYAQKTSTIIQLELEDLIERRDQTLFLEVRDIMITDQRPWKCIRLVDHLYSEERYDRYLNLKRELWRLVEDDALKRHIPVQFQAIMEIPRGSSNDYVISFLQRMSDSDDLQAIEFAGAMFGYLPRRIPDELEGLCKKGYLRETIVLKVSYRNIRNVRNPAYESAEDCAACREGEAADLAALGDSSVKIEKVRSVHVLAECIERLNELRETEMQNGEGGQGDNEGSKDVTKRDLQSGTDSSERFHSSLSDLKHDNNQSKSRRSLSKSSSFCSGLGGQKSKRGPALRRSSTTPEGIMRLRRQTDGSIYTGNSDSPQSTKPTTTIEDVASSLAKLSTMRKGHQRATNRQHSPAPRLPRTKKSRPIDGSVTRTRILRGKSVDEARSIHGRPSLERSQASDINKSCDNQERRPTLRRNNTTGGMPLRRRRAIFIPQKRSSVSSTSSSDSSQSTEPTIEDATPSLEKPSAVRKDLQQPSQRRTSLEPLNSQNNQVSDLQSCDHHKQGPRVPESEIGHSIDVFLFPQTRHLRRHKSLDGSSISPASVRRRRRPVQKANSAGPDGLRRLSEIARTRNNPPEGNRKDRDTDLPEKQEKVAEKATIELEAPPNKAEEVKDCSSAEAASETQYSKLVAAAEKGALVAGDLEPDQDQPDNDSTSDASLHLLGEPEQDQSDNGSNSGDVHEAITHNSISFMEVFGLVEEETHTNDNSKSIMELFGADTSGQDDHGSSSTLTMDDSYSVHVPSMGFSAKVESVSPSSVSTGKGKKKKKKPRDKDFHKSAPELDLYFASQLQKTKRKKPRRASPRPPMTGPLAPHRFCDSTSALGCHSMVDDDEEDTFDHPYKGQEPDFHWETNTCFTH